MKGQSINLSWVIGTTVFLTALVFSITYTFNNYSSNQAGVELQEQIGNIRENIRDETEIKIRRTPLIIKDPRLSSRIPVKENFIFNSETNDASLTAPYEINLTTGDVRSTVNTSVEELKLTQYYSDIEDESFSSDLSGGSTLSNSKLEVDPGGDGLEQITYSSTDLLQNGASFSSTNTTVVVHEIYGETLGGDLEVYDNSSEIVLDTSETNNYLFKNFTELYWRNGSTTETLTGTGDFQSGKTNGLVLNGLNGADIGAAFVGDLDANVSKPSNDTVNASIDSGNYRLYLFSEPIQEGKDRILFEENDGMFFGASKEFETLSLEELEVINDWSESKQEDRLGVETIGYNVTVDEGQGNQVSAKTDSGSEWKEGAFRSTTVATGSSLRLGPRGSENNLVGFYRMDSETDPLSGSLEVKDYSDYSNHGEFSSGSDGDERGARGVFSSNSFSLDGENDFVNISDSSSLTIDRDIAISAWIKPEEDHLGGIIQKSSENQAEYELNHLNNQEVRFGLNWNQGDEKFCGSGTGVTNIGEWNHVVAIYDPGTGSDDIKIYVNGQLEETCSYTGSINEVTGSDQLHIGINPGGNDEEFNGSIDEVQIYNSSIDSNKVDELYINGASGDFNGNYTSKTFDLGERVSFDTVDYSTDLNSSTELKIKFESVNPSGNTVDSEIFSLSDGTNSYNLDVKGQHQARVTVFGNSDNESESWTLDYFKINYDDDRNKLSVGFQIPFEDVTVSRRSYAGVSNEGEINKLDDRVAVWP